VGKLSPFQGRSSLEENIRPISDIYLPKSTPVPAQVLDGRQTPTACVVDQSLRTADCRRPVLGAIHPSLRVFVGGPSAEVLLFTAMMSERALQLQSQKKTSVLQWHDESMTTVGSPPVASVIRLRGVGTLPSGSSWTPLHIPVSHRWSCQEHKTPGVIVSMTTIGVPKEHQTILNVSKSNNL